jgi:uncharacterized protein (TIGR03086 family)
MSNSVVAELAQARDELGRRLQVLGPDDWPRPTPCTEWDTRQLVNHIVGVHFRMARLLAGGSTEVYVRTREDDWLGADHLAAWRNAAKDFDDALAALDDLGVIVAYRVPIAARDAVRLTTVETAVHCWDISRAIGFDEQLAAPVTRSAVEALETFITMPALAAFYASATSEPPADASDLQRLLHLAGRS